MKYRIGTRGSALALAQANAVRDKLAKAWPMHEFELTVIKTSGDKDRVSPLSGLGTRGVFVKEIEEQLLNDGIDLAVHSMKDMPAELPEALMLAPCWKREDARDALILRNAKDISDIRKGGIIATGSLRRVTQLKALRSDLETAGLRGNIDTRLKKLKSEGYDGIVLACAGLNRLGLSDRVTYILSPDEMVPAAAQGTLALELRRDRKDVSELLDVYTDPETDAAVSAERRYLCAMGGGCFLPVGAYCERVEGGWRLRCIFGDAEGKKIVKADVTAETPAEAADTAVAIIQKKMGE